MHNKSTIKYLKNRKNLKYLKWSQDTTFQHLVDILLQVYNEILYLDC